MGDLEKWAEETIKYSKYCKEAAQLRFENDINIFIRRAHVYDKTYFDAKVKAYSVVAEIMKELKEGSSWDIIKEIYKTHVKTILDLTLVGDLMLEYSEFGTAFIENVMDINTFQAIAELMKKYDDKKEMEYLREHGYK